MSFGQADIVVASPADGDQVSEGALRIRQLATAVRERLASLVVDVNTDPLTLKAGAIPTGYALTNPAITGGTHENGTFNNPTLSGTIAGIPTQYPPYSRAELATSGTFTSNGSYTSKVTLALAAGTYLIVGCAGFQLSGTGITTIWGGIKLSNNINSTTSYGTVQSVVGSTGISLRLDAPVVVTQLLVLASSGTVTLSVASSGANSNSGVLGADGNADTSITALRLA